MSPSLFECIIFDMDGTLTQTNELIFASFNHVAEKYLGRTLTTEQIIALFGPPEEGGIERLVGKADVGSAMNDLCAFYAAHHSRMARLHEGVEKTLAYLRSRGIRLAVFTGKGSRTANITMANLDLAGYFDLVVSGTDVKQHKPHPEGIERIISTFSVSRDRTLMVGDSLSDLAASRSAGVHMAAVLWDSYDRERMLKQETRLTFHTVEEMTTWFHEHIN